MKAYNIYYHSDKLNKYPLSKEKVINLQRKQFIMRHTNTGNERISINNIKIIECTII